MEQWKRIVAVLLCSSCLTGLQNSVRQRAAVDLSCPEQRVEVEHLDAWDFRADGCGGVATYTRVNDAWIRRPDQSAVAPGSRASHESSPSAGTPPSADARRPAGFVARELTGLPDGGLSRCTAAQLQQMHHDGMSEAAIHAACNEP